MPQWKWRTFPVYFAFAIGGFLGMYSGIIIAQANDATQAIGFAFWAIILGFGLSRFTSMWLLSRGWTRKIAQRNKR